jgi:hypothetical protein
VIEQAAVNRKEGIKRVRKKRFLSIFRREKKIPHKKNRLPPLTRNTCPQPVNGVPGEAPEGFAWIMRVITGMEKAKNERVNR